MVKVTRQLSKREADWKRQGEPPVGRRLAQIGVLGWIVVAPILIGLAAGRWLDSHFATGVFWTAPLLMIGAVLGAWSAWRWIGRA
ncbi:MAG: AtpZ/AtpI family protein [Ancalomicrobiaceae bacterium]|nr:AtpZ/AtpI family protein [Ancalomicrobiaceae bacterium]